MIEFWLGLLLVTYLHSTGSILTQDLISV